MTSIRKLALAAFLPIALIAPSAHAQNNVAQVVGTGSITPGLPTTGCAFQDVSFSGTAIDAGTLTGVYAVSFSGNSTICETLNSGEGSGTLSGDVAGTVNYTRTGSVVTIEGQGAIAGHSGVIVAAACYFNATSFNPVASYALHCTVVIDAT